MQDFPIDRTPDATIALWREGYAFISRRCERYRTDVFRTRLMLRPAVCARGAEAAEIFYDGDRFTRVGAMPQTVLRLLQDKGSVQTLDGAAHRRRKALFTSLMTPASVAALCDAFEREWLTALPDWAARGRIVLLDEVRPVLTRAVCAWAGVPADDRRLADLTRELSEMIDASGSIGPRNWRALLIRRRTERWAADLVERVRSGAVAPPDGSALAAVADHRELDGELLPTAVAAVELINVLRPVVAVGRFVVFAALALHEHPHSREALASDDAAAWRFAQEVRRFYPFFPFVGGRVRESFVWRGVDFERGTWMLFDLYGTNHDRGLWEDPGAFRPARFAARPPTPFDLVPQGAGDVAAGHRCPGEDVTVSLTMGAARLLGEVMRYTVPDQDLTVDLDRVPARPRSGFILSDVAAVG